MAAQPANPQIQEADKNYATEVAVNELSEKPADTSQPAREDQVQNAVRFLSHPKVRGSPVVYRRSFLEKKGLTKEEIDEAFRRVPDPSPTTTNVEATSNQAATQPKATAGAPANAAIQAPQLAVAGSTLVPTRTKPRLHWYHALFAAGLFVAGGAGSAVLFVKWIVPKLKDWIRKVIAEGDAVEGCSRNSKVADEAAAEAAKAAVSIAKTVEELLRAKHEESRFFEVVLSKLDSQAKEMQAMSESVNKLEWKENTAFQDKVDEQNYYPTAWNGSVTYNGRTSQKIANGHKGVKPSGSVYTPQGAGFTSQARGADGGSNYRVQETFPLSSSYQQNGKPHELWGRVMPGKSFEIEELEEPQQSRYGAVNERSVLRTWVPPQPPAVAMPEAAVAIRQPKQSKLKQQQSEGEKEEAASNLEVAADADVGATSSVSNSPHSESQEFPDNREV